MEGNIRASNHAFYSIACRGRWITWRERGSEEQRQKGMKVTMIETKMMTVEM